MSDPRKSPPPALLPYQLAWIGDKTRIKVCLKSRRCGISFASAADAVLKAAAGEDSTVYMAHTEDLAKEWFEDIFKWCDWLGFRDDTHGRPLVTDTQKLRVDFTSGCKIVGLTSNPHGFRGRKGAVIIDEGARHTDLNEVLRAAHAVGMWGGSGMQIISTADSEENPFMKLVEEVRRGKDDHSLHVIDFDDALRQGLYQRMCLVAGEVWTPEKERIWRQKEIDKQGVAADTELFCKPMSRSAGTWFNRANLPVYESIRDFGKPYPLVKRAIRFWDPAATKPSATNPDPDWTRGVLVLELDNGYYMIDDVASLRDGPAAVESLLKQTAEEDGREVEIGIWQDGGAAGKADIFTKQKLLTGYVMHNPPSSKSKQDFAKPWASLVLQGRVVVRRAPWNEEYLRELHLFPGGNHDDAVDATSGAFQVLTGKAGVWAANWSKAWSLD